MSGPAGTNGRLETSWSEPLGVARRESRRPCNPLALIVPTLLLVLVPKCPLCLVGYAARLASASRSRPRRCCARRSSFLRRSKPERELVTERVARSQNVLARVGGNTPLRRLRRALAPTGGWSSSVERTAAIGPPASAASSSGSH